MLKFTWDTAKEKLNFIKHNLNFLEASTVFLDALSITIPDPYHYGENRFVITGLSANKCVLMVVHTENFEGEIRIISARKATKKEKNQYENVK